MQNAQHGIIGEFVQLLSEGRHPSEIIRLPKFKDRLPLTELPAALHRFYVQEGDYSCLSLNLPDPAPDWQRLNDQAQAQFETVLLCYPPEDPLSLLNPENPADWSEVAPLEPESLLVFYARSRNHRDRAAEKQYLEGFRSVCRQSPKKDTDQHTASETAPVRKTPRYAVPVTNEFFHYGNVEAWRNIIDHYHETHPGMKVRLYHRDQPIHRIGTLFKWGKVNVGDVIHFSIEGPEFKDVAKLKKYLTIGASPRFSPFIKKHRHDSLNLF